MLESINILDPISFIKYIIIVNFNNLFDNHSFDFEYRTIIAGYLN